MVSKKLGENGKGIKDSMILSISALSIEFAIS